MNWRWLIFDYTDPELPLTMWQRIRIAVKSVSIRKLPPGVWKSRAAYLAVVLPTISFPALGNALMQPTGARAFWLFIILVILWVPAYWVWNCYAYGLICRREHRYRIRLEGFDVCIECGYWLRGLSDDVRHCPECGAEREPMPLAVQPSAGASS